MVTFFTAQAFDFYRSGPAFNRFFFKLKVFGGLIGQQGADLLSQLAKVFGADVGAAHQAKFMADQGVLNLMDGHGSPYVQEYVGMSGHDTC